MNNLNNMQNSNMNNQYSYDQKKNNGKGIFYGVIAVATLIVAIIGATFAYFTASANSSDNALSATAAHVEVNYTEGRQLVATNLIPAKADVVATAYEQPTAYEYNLAQGCTHVNADDDDTNDVAESDPNSYTEAKNWTCPDGASATSTGNAGTKCVDSNGYYVCATYQFSVTNTSNVAQTLQSYLTINANSFTTVDEAGAEAHNVVISDTYANRALKFMTVRSDTVIDVTAIAQGTVGTAGTCINNLTFNGTQSLQSTKFCKADGTTADIYDTNTVDADGTVGRYTDNSGNMYYYFNTTAVRQSLNDAGEIQTVFAGELLPAMDRTDLADGSGILYMHTVEQTNAVTQVGYEGNYTTVTGYYGDTNGNYYASQEACETAVYDVTTGQSKEFGVSCHQVWLTNSSEPNGQNDVVLGAFGEVTRTYYIVAWLEENNPSDTNVDGAGNKISQDEDQDKSFAATINVTSGSVDFTGITGRIEQAG